MLVTIKKKKTCGERYKKYKVMKKHQDFNENLSLEEGGPEHGNT